MNKPCEICLEEICKGSKSCNCLKCKLANDCYRFLHVTIRITNKCTQCCDHCCFSSSPSSDIMMSVEMSKTICKFLESNEILSLNIMGGEFFCNPNWFEILQNFQRFSKVIRLVSNGDWIKNNDVKNNILKLNKEVIRIDISKDRWHNNKNSDMSYIFLKENGFKTKIESIEENQDNSIIPVGRAECCDIYNQYSYINTYCNNPKNMYSFLLDEEGNIYKCPFGVLKYENIINYINGGFRKRFKEFNKKFYDIFIPSCKSCYQYSELKNLSIKK